MSNPILVILAAGKGGRLRPFTESVPKALIEYDGIALTELAIDAFAAVGVREVVMCVGYKADVLCQRLGEQRSDVEIQYAFNPRYYATGAGYSLRLASGLWMHRECIIMEGDQLFHPDVARKLMEAKPNTILVDSETPAQFAEETVVVGCDGVVDKIVWPASSVKSNDIGDVIGEAIVIVKLDRLTSTWLADLIKSETGEIIDAFDRVIENYVDVAGLPWIEIDTIEDLAKSYEVWERIKK